MTARTLKERSVINVFLQKYRRNLHFLDLVSDPIDVLGLFRPENCEEEMEKWLASPKKTYNPQFVYDEPAIYTALIRARKLRKSLPELIKSYSDSSDWRAIITHDLLTHQLADLDATISLLNAFTTGDVIEHDCALNACNQLFGEVTTNEYNLAVKLVYNPVTSTLNESLIGADEQHSYDKDKLKTIIHDYLHDFTGIVTNDEMELLRDKDVTEEQVGAVLEKVIHYMFNHAVGECQIHIRIVKVESTDHFGILPVPLQPFTYEITMPHLYKLHDGKLSASNMLQTVAHEVNGHLRVMISTEVLTERVSPHFHPNILARTKRCLAQEGFAVLNGDTCLEESEGDVLDSMTIIVPDYVKQGHNFAEAAKFIYDIYNLDPDMDHRPTHRAVWTILQSFFGAKDTSAHIGYSFPYHQVYMLGAIRALKEMVRIDKNTFEDPLSLMRYSELPLELLRKINHIEHNLKQKLVPDPFEGWDFANFNPSAPNPTEYAKQLLLDL